MKSYRDISNLYQDEENDKVIAKRTFKKDEIICVLEISSVDMMELNILENRNQVMIDEDFCTLVTVKDRFHYEDSQGYLTGQNKANCYMLGTLVVANRDIYTGEELVIQLDYDINELAEITVGEYVAHWLGVDLEECEDVTYDITEVLNLMRKTGVFINHRAMPFDHFLEVRESKYGNGLFTKRFFREGEIICIFEGDRTDQYDNKHVLYLDEEIDHAIMVNSIAKYANHDSNGNAELVGNVLYATEDIIVGTEVLFHYNEGTPDHEMDF